MQGGEYQVAGFGGGERQADGFRVTHLAHQDDIRVFTQCGAQGVGEAVGVLVQFALVYQALLTFVHKLDRVFDGEDVVMMVFVDVVDHCRQGGGFTGTGRAGYQHQAARLVGNFLEHFGRVQLFQREHFAGNGTEYGGRAAFGVECVHTETGDVGQLEGKVGFQPLLVVFTLVVVHDGSDHVAHFFGAHFRQVDAAHVAVHADHGWQAGGEVQVGCFVFHAERE